MHLETHLPLLLDLFLKSTVVLALAMLLTAAFRRASAANRHTITVAALVTLLVLPFTRLARPHWSFALNHDAPAATMNIKLPPITTKAASETGPGAALVAHESAPAKAVGIRINWSAVGVGVWLAGFALVLLQRAGVGLQLRRMTAESRAMKESRVLAVARELAASCGVRAEIRESDTCRVPLAFGVWRPTVLLPGEAMGWSDERLSAALQHEFGHIRRRDCLTRWFADLACAFYWMNPLVWLGARSLRLAQEQACDDLVLNAGTLVDESRNRSARGVRGAFAGIAFATAALALCTAAQLREADEKKAAPVANALQVEIEAKFIEITGEDPSLPEFLKVPEPKARAEGTRVLSAENADIVAKALNPRKGVDLLSSPRVTACSKQNAKIEIIREFRHATAWEKDSKSGEWKPTIFDTKNLGVTFDVTPEVNADGTIDLAMTPEVVEFAGFKDLDGDATKVFGKPDTGKPLSGRLTEGPAGIGIPEGHRAQSLFNTRKVSTNVNVSSGMTVVLGGIEQGGRQPAARNRSGDSSFSSRRASRIPRESRQRNLPASLEIPKEKPVL